MNTPDVVFHIIHPTEYSTTSVPFTRNTGIVLRFVSCTVFLAGEASLVRLGAPIMSAEEVFAVTFVVFSKIAATREDIP
jgi:hypothetical protein